MKKIALIFNIIFFSIIYAQEEIKIGEKYSFYSQILKENREYWVYLPPEYEAQKEKYPVIYLLDGESNFYSLVSIQKAFTKGMYNYMPESVIVGIINTDRTRDLTPTQSSLKRDGKVFFENSGGAENFYNFLIEELKQNIEKTYRTNGYNIIVGHSFGGLFVLNTFVHHSSSFKSYIAIDPSIWWDNKKIYKDAKELLEKKNLKGFNLFIAMAKKETKANDEHSDAIRLFCTDLLDTSARNNLRSKWKYYPEEDHGTVNMPGMYDAFKFIFKGITLPVKKIPQDPNLIEKYYKQLSEQLNFEFLPSETLINNLAEYSLSIGEMKAASKIIDYNLKNYPGNIATDKIRTKIEQSQKENSQ